MTREVETQWGGSYHAPQSVGLRRREARIIELETELAHMTRERDRYFTALTKIDEALSDLANDAFRNFNR